MKNCKVEGCKRQLDENGYPVEYCDYQQGRCPMQKEQLSVTGMLILGFIFLILGSFIWSTI